jgi:hypothetical protein
MSLQIVDNHRLVLARWDESRFWPAGALGWGLAVVVLTGVLVLWLQLFVFRGDTITTDENSYLFQARIFAAGRLWVPAPAERNLVQFQLSMINMTDDRFFSRYFFGHPLALVPGVVVGYPLLVPLLMALGSTLLAGAIGRTLYDEPTARVATLLLALSPFFLAMHATLLAHTTCLLALGVFMLGTAKAMTSTWLGWGVLAGAGLGYAFNTRPFTTVLIAWPFLAWGVLRGARTRSTVLLQQGLCLGAMASVFLGAYFLYNHLLTGSWAVSPYVLYNSSERLGFVHVRVLDWQHTPAAGWNHLRDNLERLNRWWLGFTGSFAILAGLIVGRWRVADLVLLLSAASLAGGHFFFYFPGVSTVGPVYYFEAVLALGLLGARALRAVWQRIPHWAPGPARVRAAVPLVGLIVWLLALSMFWVETIRDLTDKLAIQREFRRAVAAAAPRHAIVLIPSDGSIWHAVRLDPLGPRDVLFTRARAERDERIMRENPDRRVYRYENGVLVRLR